MYQTESTVGGGLFAVRDSLEISRLQPQTIAIMNSSGQYPAGQYEILYLRAGGGELLVNQYQNRLAPLSLYFVCPGQLRMINLNEAAEGFFLKVSEDFLHLSDTRFRLLSLLEQCKGWGNAKMIGLDNDYPGIEEILGKIEEESRRDHPLQFEMIHVFFKTFLLYLLRCSATGNAPKSSANDTRIAQAFVRLVNQHFIEKKMVGDYAEELCVTSSYLNKVVKKVTGVTASAIIQQCIIREAKKQAMQSEMNMKQIAYSLGFDDSAHFSKFFKNNCGFNFTRFKREAWLLQ